MLTFNQTGYLEPDSPILVTQQEFHDVFVVQYSSVERSMLYESYQRYSSDLKRLCSGISLRQWVDGSFVTKVELRPSDIDMVTFLDATLVEQLGASLDRFKYPNSKQHYSGIDGYLVSVYATDSPHHILTQSDELHWRSIFDKTRRNRNGMKLPKGFLEIIY